MLSKAGDPDALPSLRGVRGAARLQSPPPPPNETTGSGELIFLGVLCTSVSADGFPVKSLEFPSDAPAGSATPGAGTAGHFLARSRGLELLGTS